MGGWVELIGWVRLVAGWVFEIRDKLKLELIYSYNNKCVSSWSPNPPFPSSWLFGLTNIRVVNKARGLKVDPRAQKEITSQQD